MSEYQYYDFRAVDRALTKSEMAELRSISSRAAITASSFTNYYEWGDLKANPLKLLEKYFDAFLYFANWRVQELHFRLPEESIDFETLRTMLPGDAAYARKAGKSIIVGFTSEYEQSDAVDDGTGWMGSLLSLRSDLLRGDLRCLYLGWLLSVQYGELGDDEMEPPVPPGLKDLSASLQSLIDFMGIDEDLVEAAAEASAPPNENNGHVELDAWIQNLPEIEKTNLLIQAYSEPGEHWKHELRRRFQKQNKTQSPLTPGKVPSRTVGDLLAMSQARSDRRKHLLEIERAKKETERKAKEAAERERYLKKLEKREAETWNEIAAHIQKRQSKDYDCAVALMTDLRDIALRRGRVNEFRAMVEALRRLHSAKGNFLHRLTKEKL